MFCGFEPEFRLAEGTREDCYLYDMPAQEGLLSFRQS